MNHLGKIMAVVDTNVLVSALLSSTLNSNPFIILEAIYKQVLIPIINDKIVEEYASVLKRPKFHFTEQQVDTFLASINKYGLSVEAIQVNDEEFPDKKDMVFYEVKMAIDDSYLITGNIKHFPKKSFVVTPAEMVFILKQKKLI